MDVYTASPRFLETLGIPLLHGREFREFDGAAVIVSESPARVFRRRRNPLGQSIDLPGCATAVRAAMREVEPGLPALARLMQAYIEQVTRDLWNFVSLIFVSGGRPIVHGLICGLWLSVPTDAALHKIPGNAPVRVDSADPFLHAGAALLAIAAVAAMVAPARRGAHSDPSAALRCE